MDKEQELLNNLIHKLDAVKVALHNEDKENIDWNGIKSVLDDIKLFINKFRIK